MQFQRLHRRQQHQQDSRASAAWQALFPPLTARSLCSRVRSFQGSVLGESLPQIKVVGVGGCGSRFVSHLWDSTDECSSMDMVLINTDVQELSSTFMPDHDKLLIGARTTQWKGAGGDPRVGQEAAVEASDDIRKMFKGADLVFVLAGMAGGTGCGAAAVVADLARQQGAATVSIAMLPATHPLGPHMLTEGLKNLHSSTDTLMTFASPRPTGVAASANGAGDDHNLPISCCIQGITELLTGLDPLDLGDLQEALPAGSSTAVGFATAQGPDRLTRATYAAIHAAGHTSRLQAAPGVLCFVSCGAGWLDDELEDVREALHSLCSSVNVVHLRQIRAELPPDVAAVTVIATKPDATPDTHFGSSAQAQSTDVEAGAEGPAMREDGDKH